MRIWLLQIWDQARSSFWFVPLGMMFAAVLLALLMAGVDDQFPISDEGPLSWLLVNAATARSTLTLFSGVMITLSGVVFSMTMVTLSLTSSQFGSRLLRTAMTDLTVQVALGAFLATSLYCLVILRFIPAEADSPFVPHIAVFFGGLFSFASLVVMVLFVHNIGVSIQAQNVVAEVASDLDEAIQRIYPENLGEPHPDGEENTQENQPELGSWDEESSLTLPATCEGYLQAIDAEGLLGFATANDLVLNFLYQPGDFVIRGTPLVQLLKYNQEIDESDQEKLTEKLNATMMTGRSRTPRQDVCCAVNELVEVAVRALSPGINDPFTALACIDRMTASLTRLIARDLPSPHRFDEDQILRVITKTLAIPDVIEEAFGQIRHYGADNSVVAKRMMEGFHQLLSTAIREQDREAIRDQAERLYYRAGENRELKTLHEAICKNTARD